MVAVAQPIHRKPVVEVAYKPSPWGQRYHNLSHDSALGAGSAGPGKTEVLIHEPDQQILIEHKRCLEAIDHPFPLRWGESSGWALHLRRNFNDLGQTIGRAKKIFLAMDPGCRWIEDSSEMSLGFIFSSGFHYQFGHCHDLDDWEKYQSNAYSIICFDELVQFTEEQYDQIRSRLRSDDPVIGDPKNFLLKDRSMSNPVMRRKRGDNFVVHDPFWVRRRFVEKAPEGNKTLRRKLVRADGREEYVTWIYLPAKLHDNPNKAFVDRYELQLLSLPRPIRRALLDGDWYFQQGSFFENEWDPKYNVHGGFKCPKYWKFFRSCDWGYRTHGCVHWYAMDPDGTLWVIRELTFINMDVEEVAIEIQIIEKELGFWRNGKSSLTGPADNQLWELRGDVVVRSKAEEFSHQGINWVQADKSPGSRRRNGERVAHRMKDHDEGTKTAGLVIFQDCRQLIKTIPSIQADPADVTEPMKSGEDHWYDSLAYGVAYASRGMAGISYRDPDDDEDEERKPEEKGGYGY